MKDILGPLVCGFAMTIIAHIIGAGSGWQFIVYLVSTAIFTWFIGPILSGYGKDRD